MRRFLLTAAVAGLGLGVGGLSYSGASHAQDTAYSEMPAGVYNLDETHAQLVWRVMHAGLSNYTARFTKFDADIDFNAEDPAASTLVVTVDPTSIETDYPYPEKKDFNQKLISGEEWFNAGGFPTIKYTSNAIEIGADNKGVIRGTLEFLGVKKPLDLDVTFNGAYEKQPFSGKPTMGFSATAELMRSEWGFDTYVPNIGDKVELIIEAEFAQEVAAEDKVAE